MQKAMKGLLVGAAIEFIAGIIDVITDWSKFSSHSFEAFICGGNSGDVVLGMVKDNSIV